HKKVSILYRILCRLASIFPRKGEGYAPEAQKNSAQEEKVLRRDPHLQPVAGAEMQRRPGVLRQFRLQCGVKGVLRRGAGLQDHDGGKNVVDDLADGAGEGIDAALRRGEDIVAADAEH